MWKFGSDITRSISRKDMWALADRICARAQDLFENPLEVKFYEDIEQTGFPKVDPFLYIVEFKKCYFLRCIPYKKRIKTLFSINVLLYGTMDGKREVRCHVFEQVLYSIVEDEMRAFKDAHHLTHIAMMLDFPHRTD